MYEVVFLANAICPRLLLPNREFLGQSIAVLRERRGSQKGNPVGTFLYERFI